MKVSAFFILHQKTGLAKHFGFGPILKLLLRYMLSMKLTGVTFRKLMVSLYGTVGSQSLTTFKLVFFSFSANITVKDSGRMWNIYFNNSNTTCRLG